jgi:prepilin-type N-terminal cleavage/methylation domain-containing protein
MESSKRHGHSAGCESEGEETPSSGFTLIEMDIVLVIIGLIVGRAGRAEFGESSGPSFGSEASRTIPISCSYVSG